MIEILDTIYEAYGPTGTSTPNLLESNGAMLLRASRNTHVGGKEPLVSWPQLGACPIRPVCTVITINRVQKDFPSTPVYNMEGGGIKELQNMMDVGRRLDLKKYRSIAVAYSSVHVGDLFLLPTRKGRRTGLVVEERHIEEENVLVVRVNSINECVYVFLSWLYFPVVLSIDCNARTTYFGQEDDLPLVSVIIPVHNGGVHLQQSVKSVFSQTMHKIEVIVLDDGSTDGCVDAMLENEEISGDHRLRVKRFPTSGIFLVIAAA